MADRASKATSVKLLDDPMPLMEANQTSGEWFGPLRPLPAIAPPNVAGRAFDYSTGINLNIRPRSQETISFDVMRTLADSYDILRLIIETRKDQISKLSWTIRPWKKEKKEEARCEKLNQMFRYPDGEHDWDTWLRALLEDMLVIDAATLYPTKTIGGQTLTLDVIDGATITRKLGYDGRTPDDGVAYQQYLKGMPAASFSKDELIYRPRNWRVHKVYGYSPVEQIIMTVNIALRRQVTQLMYYTEGNVPESLIGVPTNWSTDQIRQFQTYWDSLVSGDLAQKRRARFVPGDMKYQPTREAVIKDQYDEWLARVCCFAYSISPQPFVMMMNRSTAETAHAAALEEGLAPVMQWVKNTIDFVLAKHLDAPDLEFSWDDQKQLDKKEQADVHAIYIDRKVITPDEAREEIGKEPMTPEVREAAFPPPAVPGVGDDGEGNEGMPPGKPDAKPGGQPKGTKDKGDDKGEKTEKGAEGSYLGKRAGPFARARRPINRERRAVLKARKGVRGAIERAFVGVRAEVLDCINEVRKADDALQRALAKLRYGAFDTLVTDVEGLFEELAADGGVRALAQLGFNDQAMTDLVNDRAVEWAKAHAAELVGKKWVNGKLVDNPNAKYRIDERTREGVNALVTQAEAEGWSNDKLADELADAYAFSDERAEMIARTETARADMAGNMIAYKEAGVSRKRWIVAQDDFCAICEGNAAVGAIAMTEAFPSGDAEVPAHPNCRCDVVPVLDGE